MNHHALFTRIASVDTGLLWCNLALLLAASVLPFPTGHGTYGDKIAALVLYALISAAMATTWLIMFSYLHRHPQLLRAQVPAAFFRTERIRAVAGIIAPIIPVLIGLWSPPAALVVMVITLAGAARRAHRGKMWTSLVVAAVSSAGQRGRVQRA